MQTLRVAQIMHEEVDAVPRDAPFADVVEWFLRSQRNWLYVVDKEQRFLGAISLHAIKDMLYQVDSLKMVVAADLADETFGFVTPDDRLADTMDKFYQQNSERLPVLEDATTRKLIGWLSKRDLLGVYSQEILRKRQLLGRFVTSSNDEKRDLFVELPEGFELRTVELPLHLEGRTLVELAPRSRFGVHVLAIKRRNPLTGLDTIAMTDPESVFRAGDRLILIGTFEHIAQFLGALAIDVANPKA